MENDALPFAHAPLDGETWRDALVHGPECAWCRDLGRPGAGTGAGTGTGTGTTVNATGPGGGLRAALARNWILVLSAGTVFTSLLLPRSG
ncbi:hypothetical protein ACF09Z_34770 [Streptomyces erythrochromogenes]|uniref:hypothetical protein n=1 Tax=Streptomyces erythrochromogenes TaxID=285574 RepID=UPI0036FCDE9A